MRNVDYNGVSGGPYGGVMVPAATAVFAPGFRPTDFCQPDADKKCNSNIFMHRSLNYLFIELLSVLHKIGK